MKNVLFWAIKISEFGEWDKRHNGGHVIHVTRWWRHGKQRRLDGRSLRCRWRSGRQVSSPCVNKFRIQKDISSGYATFGYPAGMVWTYLVCKVSLVVRSWLITPRHAKLCELVGKWPSAILTGQWIRRTEADRGDILNWSQFHDAGVIACDSLPISLSGKLHWSIFCDCPVF